MESNSSHLLADGFFAWCYNQVSKLITAQHWQYLLALCFGFFDMHACGKLACLRMINDIITVLSCVAQSMWWLSSWCADASTSFTTVRDTWRVRVHNVCERGC